MARAGQGVQTADPGDESLVSWVCCLHAVTRVKWQTKPTQSISQHGHTCQESRRYGTCFEGDELEGDGLAAGEEFASGEGGLDQQCVREYVRLERVGLSPHAYVFGVCFRR